MKTSENVEQISKAYVECSPELLNIAKDSKGYGYTYTSLEKLIEHTKPILSKHGLAIIQIPTGNGLISRLIHNSGEWMEQEMNSELIQMKQMNAFQVQGSQVTYLRRYMWASFCGIASDDDMDAQGEQTKEDKTPSLINEQQVVDIGSMIMESSLSVEQVCNAWKIKKLQDLQADDFMD